MTVKRTRRCVTLLVAACALVMLGLTQAGAAVPARPTAPTQDPLPPPATTTPTGRPTHGVPGPSPWTALTNPAPFFGLSMLLLTDGTVIVQDSAGNGHWWKLTPDHTGSYVNGTWSEIASMPTGYAPLYYASAVLPDGRVIIEGGEYNGTDRHAVWTTQGAIYDPVADAWTSVAPPTGGGWTYIGDAPSTVLADGQFMLGSCCSTADALLDPTTLTWTATGTAKADSNNEEGWSLLPDGDVLTVDVDNTTPLQSEMYSPVTGGWTNAGATPAKLPKKFETGPMLLQPNGDVFAAGASGKNAIYDTATGHWSAGPSFPKIARKTYVVADGPSAILPDGNVLVDASPKGKKPVHVFVFNGTSLTQVADPPNASQSASYYGRMLVLPTGQVLFNDNQTFEIYTDSGSPQPGWAPQITSAPTLLTAGDTYPISGNQLNGLTQGSAYGDDYQSATNYPLVRITNTATGDVSYAPTSGMTSMAVAPGVSSSADFTVPPGIETGPSTLTVVANGIASTPVSVTVS